MTITSEYLDEMIRAVRVSQTEKSEEEITLLINAAVLDLKIRGVTGIKTDNPLIKQAVRLYCKGHYGYDKDSERFVQAYEALADSLALCDGLAAESGDTDE